MGMKLLNYDEEEAVGAKSKAETPAGGHTREGNIAHEEPDNASSSAYRRKIKYRVQVVH